MKKFLLTFVLFLAACAPKVTATPIPIQETATSYPTRTPRLTKTPEPLPTPTNAFYSGVEASWPEQETLINQAVSSVFNDRITSPWLTPMLEVPNSIDAPHNYCNLMKFWGNVIHHQEKVPAQCKPGNNPLFDNPGIAIPLKETAKDTFFVKVFFYQPEMFCDGERCPLWPFTGDYIPVLSDMENDWKIAATCQVPSKTTNTLSRTEWQPYLNDPVAIWFLGPEGYVEVITNRDAWVSWGWASGKEWDFAFKVCP